MESKMHLDVTELRDFYASPLGIVARRMVARRIRSSWPDVSGMNVIGLGFSTPYLRLFCNEAAMVGALMPAEQGVLTWPSGGPYKSALVLENELPLPDACVHRLLAVHSLEMSESANALLQEMWRVLAANGELLLVVPNRRGMWAGPETTPFGHGRTYSRSQLTAALQKARFTPINWYNLLFMPPFSWQFLMRSAVAWERVGSRLWPAFSGVLIVVARRGA